LPAATQGAFGDVTRAARGLLPALSPQLRVTAALQELKTLLPLLEQAIVPDPSRAPLSLATARPPAGPRPPWAPRPAYAVFAVLEALEDARGQDQDDPSLARMLESALRQARIALGLDEPWSPLPRQPGSPPPVCPFSCRLPSLRMQPLAGLVRCVTPHCRDSLSRRPRATMQLAWGRDGTWHAVLVWDDGTTGLGIPPEKTRARARAEG